MGELYKAKGMDAEDTRLMSELINKEKEVWIDIMMVEELGLIESDDNRVKNTIVRFLSFGWFGCIVVLAWLGGIMSFLLGIVLKPFAKW